MFLKKKEFVHQPVEEKSVEEKYEELKSKVQELYALINGDDESTEETGEENLQEWNFDKKKNEKNVDDESDADGSGGLWLKVKGLGKTELVGSTIQMPDGFEESCAISLNHALTMLSERYEKHRISHTGNVYARVFYLESDDYWYPLADLREGVLAGAERQLMADAWQALEKQLGWRPVVKPSKKKGQG
jgi:hypothetical protein